MDCKPMGRGRCVYKYFVAQKIANGSDRFRKFPKISDGNSSTASIYETFSKFLSKSSDDRWRYYVITSRNLHESNWESPYMKLRQDPQYAKEIWKHSFISSVWPAVYTNPSRKRSFSETVFKPKEFANATFLYPFSDWNLSILKELKLQTKQGQIGFDWNGIWKQQTWYLITRGAFKLHTRFFTLKIFICSL